MIFDSGRAFGNRRTLSRRVTAYEEKKGTGQLFCEPIDGTCRGVIALRDNQHN